MSKGKTKLLTMSMATSLILTGCFNKGEEAPKDKEAPQQATVYKDTPVKVSDIKRKYKESNSTRIKPIYNVKPKEEFTFHFNSYVGDIPLDEIISVHTDSKVLSESKIDVNLQPETYDVSATTLHLNPNKPVLGSYVKGNSWGLAPMYYIRINYDLDTSKPTLLKEPIVIPFNVKSKGRAPNVKTSIKSNGDIQLNWTKQTGKYTVYNLPKVDREGNIIKNETAQEQGFSYAVPYKVGVTGKTNFNEWKGKKRTYTETKKKEIYKQNEGFTGDYFVTTGTGKNQSRASNIISVQDIADQVPYMLQENLEPIEFKSVRSLPKTVKVQMLDGSISFLPMEYNVKKAKKVKGSTNYKIEYKVKRTRFKGVVTVLRATKEDLKTLEYENNSLLLANEPTPINKTEISPKPSYKTINTTVLKEASKVVNSKDVDKGTKDKQVTESEKTSKLKPEQQLSIEQAKAKEEVLKKDGIVSQQREITKYEVMKANDKEVVYPKYVQEIKKSLHATSSLEEYLAISLMSFPKEVDMGAFPQGQENNMLQDTMESVMTQNPFVHSIKTWKYNYATNKIELTYYQPKSKLISMNERVAELVKKDYNLGLKKPTTKQLAYELMTKMQNTIRWGTTDEDLKPLSDIQKSTLQVTGQLDPTLMNKGKKNAITSTAYSAVENKVADDKGYASLYTLILRSKGVKALVMTGKLEGVDKNWVRIFDPGTKGWYNIDVSASKYNTGIKNQIFYADGSVLRGNSIVETRNYINDKYIKVTQSTSDYSKEFYKETGREVSRLSDLNKVIQSSLKTNKGVYMRVDEAITMSEVYDEITSIVQRTNMAKLTTSHLTTKGRYAYYNPNYVKPPVLTERLKNKTNKHPKKDSK